MIKGGVDLNETRLAALLFRGDIPEEPMYTGKTLFAQLIDFSDLDDICADCRAV